MFIFRKTLNKSVHELDNTYRETGQAFPQSGDARLFMAYLDLKARMNAEYAKAQGQALQDAINCRADKLRHSSHYGVIVVQIPSRGPGF